MLYEVITKREDVFETPLNYINNLNCSDANISADENDNSETNIDNTTNQVVSESIDNEDEEYF